MWLREVKLADKPKALSACSAKGTVPVLQLPDGSMIDESLEIMQWALSEHDPESWLPDDPVMRTLVGSLIERNDSEFKLQLDHYKYADRFPEHSMLYYRQQGEAFLSELEVRLQVQRYLCGEQVSIADMAVFPFIRQFAFVDKEWFDQSQYTQLRVWLDTLLNGVLFESVMDKYSPWQSDDELIVF